MQFQVDTLTNFADERGQLTFAESGHGLPFTPERFFIVFGVPPATERGGHAHRACHQYLVAVGGSVNVTLDDGSTRSTFLLDRPDRGLHIPPGVWGEQHYLDLGSRLLVLASHRYNPADYIQVYDDYLAFRKGLS